MSHYLQIFSGTFLQAEEVTDEFIAEHAKIFARAYNRRQYFTTNFVRLGGELQVIVFTGYV